jgi:hypothetical protein
MSRKYFQNTSNCEDIQRWIVELSHLINLMSSLNKNEDLWFARSEKIQTFLAVCGWKVLADLFLQTSETIPFYNLQ